MNILILGAGKMGSFFAEKIPNTNKVAVFDKLKKEPIFRDKITIIKEKCEIPSFKPDLLINCVNLQYTEEVFCEIIDFLPKTCIISDIASTKNSLDKFYKKSKFKFVSTHPMFGPTFGDINDLSNECAIIIKESCPEGIKFFQDFYESFNIKLFFYTFEQHDKLIAYSLITPFCSTFVFSAAIKNVDSPGTTFKKLLKTATGLLNEDVFLLKEIMFNKNSTNQIEKIISELEKIKIIIKKRDEKNFIKYIDKLKKNIGI